MSQPSPLLAARQRALALADSGDLGQARAVLEHAVDLGRANLGEDDPDVLLTAQQLAAVHQLAGDPSGARRVLEEAYAAGQWRLGDADPVMLLISFDLGVVAEEMENRHEARRAFGRVAAHGPAVLGAEHWAVVRARSYLGEDPPTVRMELPAEQLQRFQVPTQRAAPQDQQAPVRPQRPVAEPSPRYFPAPQEASAPQPAPPAPISEPTPHWFPAPQDANAPQPLTAEPPPHYFPAPHEASAPQSSTSEPPPHYFPTPQSAPPGYQQAAASPVPAGFQPGLPVPQSGGPYFQQSVPQVTSTAPITDRPGDSSYSRKAPALFAAIAAVFGVIIAVVALVVVLADRGDDPASDVPTLSGPAPSDVRMRDYGSSVKLFWADPANGRASFVITGGRPGEQLRPMGQVGPTTTTFDLNGLNADLDYCFAIVAVYTTSQFSTSPQTCTSRSPRTSKPSPGK
ncbi:tetratricopeptide repeat protein [Actinoplanes sp. NPDC049599]|uniref:tetratricopeptide repeat protein n=1 Tax=Actinoplanes sp. NPDC049599 TaxID=3363903 RepID=UPI0037AE8757